MNKDSLPTKKLTCEEIEKKLRREDTKNKYPESLHPHKLHKLYHEIAQQEGKSDENFECFAIWEDKVSNLIAFEFLNFDPELTYKSYTSELSKDLVTIKKNLKILQDVTDYFSRNSHDWILYSTKVGKNDFEGFKKTLQKYKLTGEYLKEHYKKKEIDFSAIGAWDTGLIEESGDITTDELNNRFIEELKNFFPSLSFRYKTTNAYRSKNKVVMNAFKSTGSQSILMNLRAHRTGKFINTDEYSRSYPFPHITRLVLYFWLEQTKPKQTPEVILAELTGRTHIIKYEFDAFLIWLWEVVISFDEYNDNKTADDVKEEIVQQLEKFIYLIKGEKPFEEYADEDKWDKFDKIKNNSLKSLKKYLQDCKDPNRIDKRIWFSPEITQRLEGIISRQTSST